MIENKEEVINVMNIIFNPESQCATCEGVFLSREKTYRDHTNNEYCEVCYKNKDLILSGTVDTKYAVKERGI